MTTLQIDTVAKQRGIGVTKLSIESKTPLPMTLRYWHNRQRSANFDVLERFAIVLGVNVKDLIKDN